MSLKIIKLDRKFGRVIILTGAAICVVFAWYSIKWNMVNTLASRINPSLPESRLIADWLTEVAPGDPRTHFAAASIYERTFDPADLQKAAAEYDAFAAAAPHNYLAWLQVGRIRSLTGDIDLADKAYKKALELAPNYADAKWSYGNFLVRQAQLEKGFAYIAESSAANPAYSKVAVTLALQIFDGNADSVRQILGNSAATNASLVTALSGAGRFEDALASWNAIDEGSKSANYSKLGETLKLELALDKKFRLAQQVAVSVWPSNVPKPQIGVVTDGGFEHGVKLRDAGLFEWQIADGLAPQLGLTEGQKRSGSYSLWIMFNPSEQGAFRPIAQTVAVEPGAQYEFEAFYRSDVNTQAVMKWEVVDAAVASTVLASTPPLALAGDWASIRTTFNVPPTVDAVTIRLARETCRGICTMHGRLSFDDISVRRL